MENRLLDYKGWGILLGGILFFSSCRSSYELVNIEGNRIEITAELDKNPDEKAVAFLAPYTKRVDSVMSPVIGHSEMNMKAFRPESLLSNLVADALKEKTAFYTKGVVPDVAVINMGGLRNDLPEGKITYGTIYEILPFENSLCVVTLNGKLLNQLFEEIAKVGGEGISGAKLIISKKGKLLQAIVGGEEIDPEKKYKVATLNYLAEGNDGMHAFWEAEDKIFPEGATIREIFLEYIAGLTKEGKSVSSVMDGRIAIEEE